MLNHITNVLSAVGDIFRTPDMPTSLQGVAAQMLATFANAYGNRPNALELQAQQLHEPEGPQRQYHTNQSLLHKSGVVADVVTALAGSLLADRVPPITPSAGKVDPLAATRALAGPLTGTLLAMSYQADNADGMVRAGVLQCVAALLQRGPHADTTPAAVELLWNVVENAPHVRDLLSRPLPSLDALSKGAARTALLGAAAAANGGGSEAGPGPGSEAGAAGRELGAQASFSQLVDAEGRIIHGNGDGASPGVSRGSVGTSGLGDGVVISSAPSNGHALAAAQVASITHSSASQEEDADWQQLPEGAASAPSTYERAVDMRSSASGFEEFEEFADDPDLRSREVSISSNRRAPPAKQPSFSLGPGGGPAPLRVEPSEPEDDVIPDSPVVQVLADALTGLLRTLLLNGFSKADKELRNDVMVAMNLLLEAPDFRAAAAYAGAFEPLLAAATSPELGAPASTTGRGGNATTSLSSDLVAGYALTTDALDQELRLLVWGAMVHGCLLPEVLELANQGGLVRVLLLYVSPGEAASHPAVRRWNPDQLSTLRSAALSRLHSLAPLCPDEYERAGGPTTLLTFVGSNPIPMHMEGALRHLHRLFTLVPESRDAFGAAGLIPVLLGVVMDSVGSGGGGGALGNHVGTLGATTSLGSLSTFGADRLMAQGNGSQPEPVRHFALLCLTALCTVHAENQRRLRKAGGVSVLAGCVAKLKGLDPLLPAPYAVAVLDCVWAAVVPDRKSAARFLVEQGMDLLLNHLESGNKGHRPIVLRVISDLLENPRSHAFFHDWQSDLNKQSAAHLLLSIWMEEDSLRGMTGHDGLLANPGRPLAGLNKRTKWLPPENVAYGNMSPAKKETLSTLFDNMHSEIVLAKIYGVFKLLGFDACPYLDPKDHAILAFVEKYAKFRQGEVWRAITEEFAATGMKPTAPDRARLESGIDLSEALAAAVREAQSRLLGRAQEGSRAAEAKLFEGMRQQARLEAEYRTIQMQEKTPLTLAEMRRAKEQKAAMLKNSLQSFQFQHGEEDE
ncbi:hypothetical protein HYH03_002888 [Edaphochlamys debaryana]|uniref:Cilia- and flagella-associated protein 69 ARM repeats domain-containing protein n=1 Tax=Edaphochlamys debaryana TaxID=47281 RepID=A0A835YIN2_9CHLO|nr:hypothetical protein HYH03_002888 [Edaphochlamys debaryana]|eukprot:KAG2499310.1 hypothetical protein HYH03_002888 [Edaphochlamys debaryana]